MNESQAPTFPSDSEMYEFLEMAALLLTEITDQEFQRLMLEAAREN